MYVPYVWIKVLSSDRGPKFGHCILGVLRRKCPCQKMLPRLKRGPTKYFASASLLGFRIEFFVGFSRANCLATWRYDLTMHSKGTRRGLSDGAKHFAKYPIFVEFLCSWNLQKNKKNSKKFEIFSTCCPCWVDLRDEILAPSDQRNPRFCRETSKNPDFGQKRSPDCKPFSVTKAYEFNKVQTWKSYFLDKV